jgi:hypothetical protein
MTSGSDVSYLIIGKRDDELIAGGNLVPREADKVASGIYYLIKAIVSNIGGVQSPIVNLCIDVTPIKADYVLLEHRMVAHPAYAVQLPREALSRTIIGFVDQVLGYRDGYGDIDK